VENDEAGTQTMSLVTLQAGRLAVELAPQAGGSIARFAVDGADIMRPMTADDIASGKGNNAATYPLVPFAGRIGEGRLVFQGETIRLAPNWPGVRHPMHGDGWCNAWQVARSDAASAVLTYLHEPAGAQGGWPFRYRAEQHFRLEQDRLTMRISIENLEERPVPAGIGLHPFFVRDADSELTCRTEAAWRTDAEVLPVERIPVPPAWDLSAGRRVDSVALDTPFEGWDGRATLAWPRRRLRLDMLAEPTLRHLVLYLPSGKDFFCVEPLSHSPGQVGQAPLAARATLAGEVILHVSSL
jgi:aldose 1-epimerase